MRGTLKTSTLESKFPLLRVENNCIISKFADITTAYRVTLPELFTLTGEEYEALHGAWLKALKVLPDYTVVHKQDFFIEERYAAPEDGSERSFLARSYERHFNERPYLRHSCYLYVTKTTPERMRQTRASSVLGRGFIVPREMRDTDAVTRFLEAAEQMERILNDSGLVRVERLTEDEIVGTADDAGLLARYFALSDERLPVVNEDIRLDPGTMRIGDKFLSMHTLSDLDMLPQSVATDFRYERLSTDRSIVPSFDTFYEFVETDYRRLLEQKRVREKDFDLANFLNVLEPYYKGGEYDYLLNSDRQLDLLDKRFIVFELDNISSNRTLLPVVTLIIMETFISKMRRLKGVRKMILIEECWKALTSANMSTYIRYLYKTVRKYFGEAVVVTQEVDDIISSPIVKESIINNADCKILLDQRKYLSKFDGIQRLLGLTDKEKAQILSINLSNDPKRRYKEVWIGLGGVQSAVYATETSVEEYLTYTTEESEKMKVMELAEKLGGDIEAAIRQLAREREMNPESCTVPL